MTHTEGGGWREARPRLPEDGHGRFTRVLNHALRGMTDVPPVRGVSPGTECVRSVTGLVCRDGYWGVPGVIFC